MWLDFQTRLDQIAQVPPGLFNDSTDYDIPQTYNGVRDANLTEAIRKYSRRRPRHLVFGYSPLGGSTFEYLLPPGTPWTTTFSPSTIGAIGIEGWNEDQFSVERIVYPLELYYAYSELNEIPKTFYTVYKKPDGRQYLRFFQYLPAQGLTVGVFYTAPHTVQNFIATNNPSAGSNVVIELAATSSGVSSTLGLLPGTAVTVSSGGSGSSAEVALIMSTVPGVSVTVQSLVNSYATPTLSVDTVSSEHPADLDAICHLAASRLCTAAANQYADKQHSSIGADSINYGSLSGQWQKRADREEQLYEEHIKGANSVSGVSFCWPGTSYGGGERLFKRKIFDS